MKPTRLGVLGDRTDPAALAAGLQVVLADEADRRRGAREFIIRNQFLPQNATVEIVA